MRARLGDRWWRLRSVPRITSDGRECWGKTWHDRREICIVPHRSSRRLLDTYLHEAIHACRPELREETVLQMASELTALVYDVLGFRQVAV